MAKQEKNTVYVIRCLQTGIHKIGITGDWARRSRELEVGTKTAAVRVARVNDGPQLEKWLHRRYKAVRLPQTEYFQLSADQLEHVLAALDKAANDHQQAAAKQQGDITRPRFEARQRVIATAPATPRPAPAAIPQQQAERVTAQAQQCTASLPELLSFLAVLAVFPIALSGLFSGLEQARLSRQWATFHQNCSQSNLAKVKASWGVKAAIELDNSCKRNRPQ
jgi:hypothetical protein